ncbi:hypothetical protein PPV_Vac110-(067-068)n1 [Avipoxvirus sp.]|nr:hypothetical protein PPV_Vac110-(067-068)n1 [Avipoxvirus sp.]
MMLVLSHSPNLAKVNHPSNPLPNPKKTLLVNHQINLLPNPKKALLANPVQISLVVYVIKKLIFERTVGAFIQYYYLI